MPIATYGTATADYSAAFAGGTNNPVPCAAVFGGRVVINGSLRKWREKRGGAASRRCPPPRVLCGVTGVVAGELRRGQDHGGAGREVRLDPDFLAVADTKAMHVFVNEVGQSSNIGVTAKSAQGFTVEADSTLPAMRGKRMTDVSNTFSYRVVARRKDIPANRLAKVTLPEVKIDTSFSKPMPPAGPDSQAKR